MRHLGARLPQCPVRMVLAAGEGRGSASSLVLGVLPTPGCEAGQLGWGRTEQPHLGACPGKRSRAGRQLELTRGHSLCLQHLDYGVSIGAISKQGYFPLAIVKRPDGKHSFL